nr:transposase (putative), gypsy type [Tanacetum cinerariifolium]
MSESSYTLYMAFLGILLALVAQLHRSLPEGLIKGLRLAVAVFVVNFGVGWWSLQQLSTPRGHHFLIHSHSVAISNLLPDHDIKSSDFVVHFVIRDISVDRVRSNIDPLEEYTDNHIWQIEEYDSPRKLLERKSSFSKAVAGSSSTPPNTFGFKIQYRRGCALWGLRFSLAFGKDAANIFGGLRLSPLIQLEDLHPELPGPEERIVDFSEGKVVICAAKVSHFEINCRVLNTVPTLSLFRVFYIPSFNSERMSFSKRQGKNTRQCYTKPLDSLKNWNNRFFWVDERIFLTVTDWRTSAPKDEMPARDTYSVEAVTILNTQRNPIQKQPETLMCLVDMDLFNLIRALNPTKVKTSTRPRAAHEVPLLTVTTSWVIEMEDPAMATDSSGVPSPIERSPLDFANENPSQQSIGGNETEDQGQGTVAPERCAEMEARLDALSTDFVEELYPHMLTAIAGIAKGMSEGLKYGVEHGRANLDLEAIEAYDSEADAKYVTALHTLRDLKYPMVDQQERLKDAPIDVIMASLHLESDTGDDAPQWIRKLRPSSSQLKIPVYPDVRDPQDPWAFKEEILLADAIAANVSRAEKKKKCRVICRTHGVGFTHRARSDGVPVSVPTVAPQGLAILLTDAATQTETSEDDLSQCLMCSVGVFSYAPNVLGTCQLRTQSLRVLGLQPVYEAGLL